MSALQAYTWKGNVRELENVIERALILSHGETIQLYHLPEEFQTLTEPAQRPMSLEEIEQQHIIKGAEGCEGSGRGGDAAGIDPATLWRKRKKYSL